MSYLLTAPTAVLVVSDSSSLSSAISDGRVPADVGAVYGADSVGTAHEAIDAHDDIGVVVVTDDLHETVEDFLVEACGRLRAAHDLLPIVALVEDADGHAVADATQAGASAVVVAGDEHRLASAIETGIERYERRRSERAESDMFRTLLENIGVSIYVKDEEARHLRLANVPGAPDPKNARGKTDAALYGDEEGAEQTRTDDERVIEDGETIREKVEHFEAEGSDVWTRTTKVPWRDDDGEVQGLVGLSLQITDEIRKEQQIQTFEERFDKFASHLSHDLKTPLQVASGQLELARETGDERAFEKVSTSLERMERMIEDMSALATEERDLSFEMFDERGEIEEITDPTNVRTVLEEIWSVVDTDEATLDVRFEPEAMIVASDSSVRPPLENLLRNAVVHAGPDVTVEVGPLADWSGLYVADDGPGIPADEREAVFEEGYTTHDHGTGTGLAIVAESIEQRGWTLELTESASGGARFEIGNCPTINRPNYEVTPTDPVTIGDGVDIGDVDGSERYDAEADCWTIEGGGANIWRQVNEFRYVHAEVDGPVRIEGRVTSPAALSEYSKSAFLLRDGLDPDAAYGGVAVTPQHGTELLWRSAVGADGVSQHFEDQPQQFPWYRVDRVGDVITCYCSADGVQWHHTGQRRVALADPVHVGLGVCSFVSGASTDATFENVDVRRLAVEE